MAWTQTGSLKGPKGDTGAQGERGERGPQGDQGLQGPRGEVGPQGIQGPRGEQGPKGVDGKGVEVAGQVATYADLPTDLKASDAGKGFIVNTSASGTGDIYVWTGAAFPPDGKGVDFVGPQGDRGPQGDQGPRGEAGPQGSRGPQGDAGPKGDKGDAGQRGAKWFTGAGVPGQVTGSAVGDMYLDTSSGVVYQLN